MSRRLLWALGFAQICSWGTLFYSFPQIAVAMGEDLGWAKPDIYGALTVGLLLSAAAAIPVGALIDRGHGRVVMTGGSILAGLLLLLWSQAETLVWFYLAFAGIGLLQASVLYTAVFAVVAQYCEADEIRDHITTLTLWGGFASTLFIPLIELLMGFLAWRQVLMVLAAVNIVVCAGIYGMLPRGSGSAPKNTADGETAGERQMAKWALAQPVFWALLLFLAFYAVADNAFRFHFYPMMVESGLSGENAVFVLALLGPAQVAGRVLLKLFQSPSIVRVGVLVACAMPIALIAIALFPDRLGVLSVAIVVYGGAAGVMTIVIGVVVPELLTGNAYGLINGMLTAPNMVLRAFAPSIAAVSWALTGGYEGLMYGLVAAGAFATLMFAGAAALSKRPRRQD